MIKNTNKLIQYLIMSIIFTMVFVNINECRRGMLIYVFQYNNDFIVYVNSILIGTYVLSLGGIIVGAIIDRIDAKKVIKPFFMIIILLNMVGGMTSRFIENGEQFGLIVAIVIALIFVTVLKILIELVPKIIAKKKFIYFNACIVLPVIIIPRINLTIDIPINIWEFNIVGLIALYLFLKMIMKGIDDEVIYTEENERVWRSILFAFKSIYSDRNLLKAYLSIIYSTVAATTIGGYIIEYILQKYKETAYHLRIDSKMGYVIIGVVILFIVFFRDKKSSDIINRFVYISPLLMVTFCFSDVLNETMREWILWSISVVIASAMIFIEIHLKTYINEHYKRNMNGKLIAMTDAVRNLTMAIVIAIPFIKDRFLIYIDSNMVTFTGALIMIVVFLAISGVFIKKKNIKN